MSVNRIRSLRPSTVFVDVCPRDTHTPHGLSCFRRGRRGTCSVHSTAPATGLTTLGTGLARTGTNTGTVYSKNRIKEKGVKITLRRLGFGTLKSTIASKQRTRRAVSTHLGHLTSLSSYMLLTPHWQRLTGMCDLVDDVDGPSQEIGYEDSRNDYSSSNSTSQVNIALSCPISPPLSLYPYLPPPHT